MDKDTIKKILDTVFSFLGKKATEAVAQPVAQVQVQIDPPAPAPEAAPAEIDWSNPKCKITARFSVKEALYLPSWGVMHVPSEDEKAAIKSVAEQVTKAVDWLESKLGKKCPVNVHVWMRPSQASIPGSQWDGKDYNRYIYETQVWKDLSPEEKAKKTVPNSPHKTGHAIDFNIIGYEGKDKCHEIRQLFVAELERLGLRMEDLEGGWVHLDNLPVVHLRFFKP